MVRQLREVIRQHSTHNDLDADEVMNVFQSADKQEKKKKRKSAAKKRIGPQSQLSSAFLGTGISTNDWKQQDGLYQHRNKGNDDDDDDEDEDEDEDEEEDEESESMYHDNSSGRDSFVSSSNRLFKSAYDSTTPSKLTKRKQYGIGSIKMGRRTFQDFLKIIQEEKNLLDLKRVRNDIVTQIRKKKAHIGLWDTAHLKRTEAY